MCPACLAAAALIAGGAISTGGVAALAVKKLWKNKIINGNDAQNKGKEICNGQ
jgi:hypothetical protein